MKNMSITLVIYIMYLQFKFVNDQIWANPRKHKHYLNEIITSYW